MSKPTFLTNGMGHIVGTDLAAHFDHLLGKLVDPPNIDIATAYFNPAGFRFIATELNTVITRGGHVRLLLGAEAAPAYRPPQLTEIPAIIDASSLTSRDRLGFTVEADRDARALLDWLQHDRVEVRRLTSDFLHGKAYIARAESAIVGSSNFTGAGLGSNLELNLGAYQPETVDRVGEWFDVVWGRATDYKAELTAAFADRFEEFEPYDIYLRMLLERYGGGLDEPDPQVPPTLTAFQVDGADRAERILETWGGVLICDGVGLGKTFLAGELLRRAEIDRRQRTLVVAPRAVQSSWKSYKRRSGLKFDLITYDQLVDWDTTAARREVEPDPNRYALVVIDEAHAFRNDTTRRSEALHRLLAGSPRKHVALLTATPVNNRLSDLEHLIAYFVPNDTAFVAQGIPSISQFFARLDKADADTLKPEELFPILDEIAVRRTRAFVREFYANATIQGPSGPIPVRFPDSDVQALTYTVAAPELFDRIAHAVSCSAEDVASCPHDSEIAALPTLTMARYLPSRYNPSAAADRRQQEGNVAGLLLSGLLKRFESSIAAFESTCTTMASTHDTFLAALDQGRVLRATDLNKLRQRLDDGDDLAGIMDGLDVEPADTYDITALRADVLSDASVLRDLAAAAALVRAEGDPKLDRLVGRLHEIAASAETNGAPDERKVLIFSAYSDTVRYLHDTLKTHSGSHMCPYPAKRQAAVTGSDDEASMARVTDAFAPLSTEAVPLDETDPGKRHGSIDLLVATDVLAEGVNLQQACHLINYDLPWNPMRIVQRHGRISRIGSPHTTIHLDCFFPDADLEVLLRLETRLRRKIAQANAAVGVEHSPLPGVADTGHVYTDDPTGAAAVLALAAGDASILDRAEMAPSGTSGEEFRGALARTLRHHPDERRRITRLPLGIGSGRTAAVSELTYLFCVRVGTSGQARYAAVRGGRVVTTDTLEVLRSARCLDGEPRVLTEPAIDGAFPSWELARERVMSDWAPLTDRRTMRLQTPAVMRRAADVVRANFDDVPPGVDVAMLTSRLEGAYTARIRRRFQVLEKTVKDIGLTPTEHLARIVALVEELDLPVYSEAEPLPLVNAEDIELVAWLALVPLDTVGSTRRGQA